MHVIVTNYRNKVIPQHTNWSGIVVLKAAKQNFCILSSRNKREREIPQHINMCFFLLFTWDFFFN